MAGTRALVIGGTGPTGPYIVEGLMDRGYEVTILHSGQHEVEYSRPVAHLHGDPHFQETLEDTLAQGPKTYDLVVFMYGRLRIAAEVLKGRTPRVVAVGGAGGYARPDDPAWGPLGQPLLPNEDGAWQMDQEADKFGYLLHHSEEVLLQAHRAGHYNATVVRPPNMYGPRQLGPEDWCIIRRVLDGRQRIIIADGGLKIEGRIYVENSAQAVLLAVDKPDDSAGKRYNVRDEILFTLKQRIEFIANLMGHTFEFVDLPYDLAKPAHPLWKHHPNHRIRDDRRIREELGYTDLVPVPEALPKAVQWLLDNQPQRGGEEENQIGDPFDYAAEDALIAAWEKGRAAVEAVPFTIPPAAHPYRHPKKPGEAWSRPGASSYRRQ